MIKAIEIIISSGINSNKYLISYTNKTCCVNDKKYKVTDKYLNDLKNTLLHWQNEYGFSNLIDVEEFTVIVYTEDEQDKYHGKGKYPNNYRLFKDLLGEFNG